MSGRRCLPAVSWCLAAALLVPLAAAGQRRLEVQAGAGGARSVPARPVNPNNPEVRAVLDRYCVSCHNDRVRTGGLALDTLDLAAVPSHADVWEQVVRKLRAGVMPPAGVARPDEPTYSRLIDWLETSLDRAAAAAPNPGAPSLRRLNRAEYANTIRDLVALEVNPALLLPPDDSSSGFDNNADVLGSSPALLERYLSAARKISALAVGDLRIPQSTETYRTPPDLSQTGHIEGLPLGTRGGLAIRHTFPVDGDYVIKVKLLETTLANLRGLEYENQVEVLLDGVRIHSARVGGAEDFVGSTVNATTVLNDVGARLTVRLKVTAGPHEVATAFLHKSAAQGALRYQPFLRSNVDTTDWTGLQHIEGITIVGPFDATGPGDTPSRRRIFVCRPGSSVGGGERRAPALPAVPVMEDASCGRQIVATLARRAYRRPVTGAELGRLMTFFDAGRADASHGSAGAGGFDAGIERALRSILASPSFIFRPEEDPPRALAGAAHRVTDLELASRLSFFLWSSIPDDDLVKVAVRGQLRSPAVLEQQVRRMLLDPRATALVDNFAGQWLQLRNLRASIPNQNDFPDFDDNLRQAFRRETELLFQSIVVDDRSVLDLLTADYTFVNERLAKHYGIPNVYGSQFRRVPMRDEARRGLLGHGGILLVTSHADRTSPVLRGKWILDNLLGIPPPPAPANVPALEESRGTRPRTMREQMEVHRANAVCASCHRLMDPLGLAMENFDAVGAWRTRDADSPIDASGLIADGTRVDGPAALRQALVRRPEVFVGTMTEKLLTYALGRGLDTYDKPAVRAVLKSASLGGYRFSDIVMGIVKSVPFQMRTKPSGDGAAPGLTARAAP